MDLTPERIKIDEIDEQLVKLIEQRMDVCKMVGLKKKAEGFPVLDEGRENSKLAKIEEMTANKEYSEATNAVFVTIMAQSRKIQEKL